MYFFQIHDFANQDCRPKFLKIPIFGEKKNSLKPQKIRSNFEKFFSFRTWEGTFRTVTVMPHEMLFNSIFFSRKLFYMGLFFVILIFS